MLSVQRALVPVLACEVALYRGECAEPLVLSSTMCLLAQIASGKVLTEVDIDLQLTGRRKQQQGFIEPSFPTIAGANSNGAVIHYRAKEETAK